MSEKEEEEEKKEGFSDRIFLGINPPSLRPRVTFPPRYIEGAIVSQFQEIFKAGFGLRS